MTFGSYMLAIFLSPVYFAKRGRGGAAVCHGVLYLVALVLLPVFGVGAFVWLGCLTHAAWDLRSVMVEETLQRQATLLAERMRQ